MNADQEVPRRSVRRIRRRFGPHAAQSLAPTAPSRAGSSALAVCVKSRYLCLFRAIPNQKLEHDTFRCSNLAEVADDCWRWPFQPMCAGDQALPRSSPERTSTST